jgi:hypothetical protein
MRRLWDVQQSATLFRGNRDRPADVNNGGISGFIATAITGDRAITSVTGSAVMALAGGRSCRAAVVACERTRQPNSQKQF